MSRVFISATRKSSGKTTVALGICAALVRRGLCVQTFKKGPDYIDPMWLSRSSGRPCINLDFNTMGRQEILETLLRYQAGADISVIEGNKGLYDGLDTLGYDSNAALAKLTKTPVVLVLDSQGSTRGVAPLILGYQHFDPEVEFLGVVLNKTGGSRHESKLRSVIEHYTDIDVLGCVPNKKVLTVDERHLGLTTCQETELASQSIDSAGAAMEACIDLDRLVQGSADRSQKVESNITISGTSTSGISTSGISASCASISRDKILAKDQPSLHIGIARDSAFCFYYHDDLEMMKQQGATITFFDTIKDEALPEVDALFIGGGFPETHKEQLAANQKMRGAIRHFANSGKPIYAECGGLMYLTRTIRWKDEESEMVGIIPADTVMHDRPVGRGYVKLTQEPNHPWASCNRALFQQQPDNEQIKKEQDTVSDELSYDLTGNGGINAHEFHYSSLINIDDNVRYGYQVKRGHGVDGERDGILIDNVFASYAHLRHSATNPWVTDFLNFVRSNKITRANILDREFAPLRQSH